MDQQILDELAGFFQVALQQIQIVGELVDVRDAHPAMDAPGQGVVLILAKIVTCARVQQGEHILDAGALGIRGEILCQLRSRGVDVRMPGIAYQRLGHVLGREHEIDRTRGRCMAWHAVEFGKFGVLRDTQAAGLLDIRKPGGAIAARAR